MYILFSNSAGTRRKSTLRTLFNSPTLLYLHFHYFSSEALTYYNLSNVENSTDVPREGYSFSACFHIEGGSANTLLDSLLVPVYTVHFPQVIQPNEVGGVYFFYL